MDKILSAEHGVVCRIADGPLNYFGWPTVARMDDGTLAVVSSGLRSEHICPWGKTVLNLSHDDGRTWTPPRVINNSPIDDRDAGVISLGGDRLLATWFASDTREYAKIDWVKSWLGEEAVKSWQATLGGWTDELVNRHLGSWVILSDDGGQTWGPPARSPVSAPHGPIRLRSGQLLYLGKPFGTMNDLRVGGIAAAGSCDGGRTWQSLGQVPAAAETDPANYHEPHAVELPSGKLVGMIRIENHPGRTLDAAGIPTFSMMQTESLDGGRTWSPPRPLGFHGSPPHLVRHSSGALLLTYGYRKPAFGQRLAISRDEGATWDSDWIIRGDGPDNDLGYPSTVELADGSLFTVCYQKVGDDHYCSLLWSRWRLP